MTRRPRPTLVIFFMLSFAVLAGVAAVARLGVSADEPEQPAATLDGVLLSQEEAEQIRAVLPVAVMVDNVVDARPQIGLDSADLVYELLVEGGISRFMAVYLRQEAERIEPVRSARTPFLYLARELGAVLGHVGAAGTDGPTDALSQFGRWGVLHLDEQFNPGAFRRDATRIAPHNTITSTYELRGHAAGLGWESAGELAAWRFKEDFAAGNQTGGGATAIDYGFYWGRPALYDYTADWEYEPEGNVYRRSMAGRPHVDGLSGAQLTAKNVVVQFDHAETVNGEGHVLYGSVGGGRAYIFQDGSVIEGTWTKPSREERTRYWDAEGKEVQFNRGSTWIAILPQGSPLDWH
jgi:hypothetical protein